MSDIDFSKMKPQLSKSAGRDFRQKAKEKEEVFNIEWLPQKRQLDFIKACGLDHPFTHYIALDDGDSPKIFRRKDDKPDSISKPKARIIGYGGAAGGGKGLRASGKVVTPYGLRRMEDIELGDRVSSPTHGNTQVIGKYDLGVKSIYEVNFADGTSLDVTDDHIWFLLKNSNLEYEHMTTKEIIKFLENDKGRLKIPEYREDKPISTEDFTKNTHKVIKSVVPSDKEQAYCIKVDNPNGLFVAGEDLIVTHNTDAMLMTLFIGMLTNPGANCGYFRRKFTQLEGPGGAIMRSKELFNDFPGAKWNGTKRRWTFEKLNNSVLEFCHLQNEDDVYNYQSQQFDYIAFDEATQFTRFQYRYLLSRNRATVNGVYPLYIMSTNPGGIGHHWFKNEFVDIGEFEKPHEVEVEPGRYETHMFIPAYLKDNIILEDRDPGYRRSLENMSDIESERLLEGNWDIHSGQFFPEFNRDIHVVEPFDIPVYWKRFISIDYGLDMSAVYWWALSNTGFYYCYKQLYRPNLALSDLAKEIHKKTTPIERDYLAYTVASPDLWNRRQETGKPGVQILTDNGMRGYGLIPADNRRVEGWRVVREYLKPFPDPEFERDKEDAPLTARILFFRHHASSLITNIPMLQRDDDNPDDASDTPHEVTHGPESFRYFCMSRPPLKSYTDDEKDEIKRRRAERTVPTSKVTNY